EHEVDLPGWCLRQRLRDLAFDVVLVVEPSVPSQHAALRGGDGLRRTARLPAGMEGAEDHADRGLEEKAQSVRSDLRELAAEPAERLPVEWRAVARVDAADGTHELLRPAFNIAPGL